MKIRRARVADIPDIQAIYAHHVLNGTGTFEEEPPSVEATQARFRAAEGHGWDWLVAEDATGILGFAYFSQYRARSAYRYCAEDSIYVRDDVRGQGVGKALATELIDAAAAAGFRQMIAVIGDADNIASIGAHASVGFKRVGVLRAAGLKFGRWLDVVLMQRSLGKGESDIPSAPSEPRG